MSTAAVLNDVTNGEGQRHVAIDGKTLRRSFDNFLDRRAAHILSAFASDTALVLAHLDCDCVFRSKSARHSDLMSAGDSEVKSAIPI